MQEGTGQIAHERPDLRPARGWHSDGQSTPRTGYRPCARRPPARGPHHGVSTPGKTPPSAITTTPDPTNQPHADGQQSRDQGTDTGRKDGTLSTCARPIRNLAAKNFSGGNQQKIVLAREIERNPDLLLVGQPTRGVDIGAIEFIHQQIVALRDQGKAILLVSVELEEILVPVGPHRRHVRRQGHGRTQCRTETDEKELGLLMAGITDTAKRAFSVEEIEEEPCPCPRRSEQGDLTCL